MEKERSKGKDNPSTPASKYEALIRECLRVVQLPRGERSAMREGVQELADAASASFSTLRIGERARIAATVQGDVLDGAGFAANVRTIIMASQSMKRGYFKQVRRS